MAVHMYGLAADMPGFEALCNKRGLVLLEDAAQAHGAAIGDRHVGSWGTASFSFYPSKNMTTTEGGMVLTNDDTVAARLRMIRNQGMSDQYQHEIMGYNFRMTELCAAVGMIQMDSLPTWTAQRIRNAEHYIRGLAGVVVTPKVRLGQTHVFHQFTVRLPGGKSRNGLSRDAVVKQLNERGIGSRVYYPVPIHRQPALRALGYGDAVLPETDRACAEVFSLPIHPSLSEDDRRQVIAGVSALC